MRKLNKKITAGIGGAAVAVASAGVAYAYWSTSGSGDGSATTGTSSAVSVTQDSPAVTGLVPGGPAQTITFHVTNPATFNQYVASVVVTVANPSSAWTSQADSGKPVCSAADFTITQPAAINSDLTPGNHTYTAQIALNDSATNQDNCKSVTVPLHFVAS